MRTKEQILKDSLARTVKVPNWDLTASLHKRLTIEVLIDIRDMLNNRLLEISREFYRQGKNK